MANEILTFTEVDTELGCGFAPPNVYAEMEERDFSSAAEFYAFCRKLLGGLYDEYDFEKLMPVTDGNVERVSRARWRPLVCTRASGWVILLSTGSLEDTA